MLIYWLKSLTPVLQPMTSKTKTNHPFSRAFEQAASCNLLGILIGSSHCLLLLWLVGVITLAKSESLNVGRDMWISLKLFLETKNNSSEIHISQGPEWAFPSLSPIMALALALGFRQSLKTALTAKWSSFYITNCFISYVWVFSFILKRRSKTELKEVLIHSFDYIILVPEERRPFN